MKTIWKDKRIFLTPKIKHAYLGFSVHLNPGFSLLTSGDALKLLRWNASVIWWTSHIETISQMRRSEKEWLQTLSDVTVCLTLWRKEKTYYRHVTKSSGLATPTSCKVECRKEDDEADRRKVGKIRFRNVQTCLLLSRWVKLMTWKRWRVMVRKSSVMPLHQPPPGVTCLMIPVCLPRRNMLDYFTVKLLTFKWWYPVSRLWGWFHRIIKIRKGEVVL